MVFEKTLTDVVKGIRASKRDTALYISQCIAEIKTEINSSDMFVKANALQKLTFLQMMGYSMNWASFATIEVMSSPRFAHKRIGYLAAGQGFTQDTEVILLTTNLLKKELRGAVGGGMTGVYEAGLAINCISNIVTEDLARDLLSELVDLTSHPQPYLRKKAILCLFKVFVKYPQGLRLTFAKLQQCLQDSNPAVVSCAVNVITELSDKNPRNYLHLAPAFFSLLTNSSNNWMLIKVVKLLGSLVPEEPRLARKLLEPLASIVRSTQAKSLLYECVHTITLCLPYCRKSDGSMPPIVPEIVTLSAQTLRSLVEESDQNLKYLGLVGFASLMQSHPRVLSTSDYRPLILVCLSDQDVTIRTRALDLLVGLATRKNLMELVTQLLTHVRLARGSYRNGLVAKIIEMCSAEKYALLMDFGWYLDLLLLELGHMMPGLQAHADLLRAQVTDVALRVLPIRVHAVQRAMILLYASQQQKKDDPELNSTSISLPETNGAETGRGRSLLLELLPALAWIVGEYSDLIPEALEGLEDAEQVPPILDANTQLFLDLLDEPEQQVGSVATLGCYHALIQVLTFPGSIKALPTSTQKIYVQASAKVFAAATAAKKAMSSKVKAGELEACLVTLKSNLPIFMQSTDVEVVERAFTVMELLKSLGLGGDNSSFQSVFPPGLAKVDDDEDDDEEDETDPKPAASASMTDLLGLGGTSGNSVSAGDTSSKIATFDLTPGPTVGSLGEKAANAAELLNYIFKPAPMKPIGAKAQRKKLHSPVGHNVDLSAPLDLSVIEGLIEEESRYLNGTRLSMESVSFTQQRPVPVHDEVPRPAIEMANVAPAMNSPATSDHFGSFQNQGPTATSPPKPRPHDPFYLDSAPTGSYDVEADTANRFGTIQLLDDDEENEGRAGKTKKKKKSKNKKHSTAPTVDPFGGMMDIATTSTTATGQATIYDSEDDEDDDLNTRAGRKAGTSKEFLNLAKVDLTTPLRDDEVMPVQKHREVPTHQTAELKKKGKKEKKKSKKKGAKANEDAVQSMPVEGDLLDLSGFSSGPGPAHETPAASNENAISSAFGDLLDLTLPAPEPQLAAQPPASTATSDFVGMTGPPPAAKPAKSPKRPWIRGAMKVSTGTGPANVDWSLVHTYFRVYRSTQGTGLAALLAIRVDNGNNNVPLTGVTIDILNAGSILIGDVGQNAQAISQKIGPVAYQQTDASLELSATLRCSEGSVSIKYVLPAILHLNPEENLNLEVVAEELSSGVWSSNTVKLDVGSLGTNPQVVKQAVANFLRAGEVVENAPSLKNGTFAASSSAGAKLRALVKVKDTVAKVDLRCTDGNLGSALAMDLKRVVF